MQPQDPDAARLRVVASESEPDDSPSHVDETSADISLLYGGRLRASRDEPIVRYLLPTVPPDADLLRPYLAPGAALFAKWTGLEALHAGAFATSAGAILVLGDKESGKSTQL